MSIQDADGRDLQVGSRVIATNISSFKKIFSQLAGANDWVDYVKQTTARGSNGRTGPTQAQLDESAAKNFNRELFVVWAVSPTDIKVGAPTDRSRLVSVAPGDVRTAPRSSVAPLVPPKPPAETGNSVLSYLKKSYFGVPGYGLLLVGAGGIAAGVTFWIRRSKAS